MHNTATNALELWLGDTNGNVFRAIQPAVFTDAGANYTPFVQTAPVRYYTRKILRRVVLFVGPAGAAAQTWQLTYKVDQDPVGRTVTFLPSTTGRQSAQGNELIYELEQQAVGNTFDFKVTFPTTAGDLYIEKMLVFLDDEQEDATNG